MYHSDSNPPVFRDDSEFLHQILRACTFYWAKFSAYQFIAHCVIFYSLSSVELHILVISGVITKFIFLASSHDVKRKLNRSQSNQMSLLTVLFCGYIKGEMLLFPFMVN